MYAAILRAFLKKHYILWYMSCTTTICCVPSGKYIKNFLDRSEESRYNNSCSTSYFETDFLSMIGKKGCCNMQLSVCHEKGNCSKISFSHFFKATPHKACCKVIRRALYGVVLMFRTQNTTGAGYKYIQERCTKPTSELCAVLSKVFPKGLVLVKRISAFIESGSSIIVWNRRREL